MWLFSNVILINYTSQVSSARSCVSNPLSVLPDRKEGKEISKEKAMPIARKENSLKKNRHNLLGLPWSNCVIWPPLLRGVLRNASV